MDFSLKIHLWITIVLTILLGLAAAMFHVPDYSEVISHPQFEQFDIAERVIAEINTTDDIPWYKHPNFWYKCFFFIDFIWAASFLFLLYRWIRRENLNIQDQDEKANLVESLLLIFSIAAFISDLFENILYLRLLTRMDIDLLSFIVKIKTVLYAIVLILVLVFLYQKYVYKILSLIGRAIKASLISLLTILLLVILATLMDQGSTVIIHLLTQPISLAVAIVLINLLAMAAAHYPDYIDKYFDRSETSTAVTSVRWNMYPMFGKRPLLGMGLITYEELNKGNASTDASTEVQRQLPVEKSGFFDHFRKITGLLVLMTWLYVLLYVSTKYKLFQAPLMAMTLVLMILFLVLYFDVYKIRQYWRQHVTIYAQKIKSPDETNRLETNSNISGVPFPANVRFFLIATLVTFGLLFVSFVVTIYVATKGTWVQSWNALIVTTFINIIFFILFQHFRTVFSMMATSLWMRLIPVYYLHNDLQYVRFFAMMGFLSSIAFVLLTYDPVFVNALVIILLFLYLIYGLIVVLVKHHLYYSSMLKIDTEGKNLPKVFFEKYVPIIGLLIVFWIFYSGKVGNGLHRLPALDESNSLVSIHDYKHQLCNHDSSSRDASSILIASYGGGLRATAWTMLVMDTIEKIHPDLLDRTLAMSGVSGGFLGLSMYSAIRHEHPSAQIRMNRIDTIGKHNILSIDLAYLLGFDFVREMIPYYSNFYYRDRAGRSMQQYASLIQPDQEKRKTLMESTYRQYWSNAFQNANTNYFPVLIGNTTGTHSRYGVAYSIGKNNTTFDTIFPGASDILTLTDDRSITYLDATSTTERFPIFSPTAQIDGKGHFLDGGYFENSGLLSLMNFYDYLQQDTALCLHDTTTKIVLFINSKDAFIRHVIRNVAIRHKDLATGEMSAILETITDTDILPLAVEERLKIRFGNRFIPIYLPYPIEYEEVVDLIRGHPQDPFMIQDTINASNNEIEKLLKPYKDMNIYPVPPALARVLSEPAYAYLKIMLHHPEVQKALSQL